MPNSSLAAWICEFCLKLVQASPGFCMTTMFYGKARDYYHKNLYLSSQFIINLTCDYFSLVHTKCGAIHGNEMQGWRASAAVPRGKLWIDPIFHDFIIEGSMRVKDNIIYAENGSSNSKEERRETNYRKLTYEPHGWSQDGGTYLYSQRSKVRVDKHNGTGPKHRFGTFWHFV
jgi:hypothetical protein